VLPNAAAGQAFKCKNCGAPARWDPDADALRCEHCESVTPVPRAQAAIVERPLEARAEAETGLGVAVRASRCSSCGATVCLGERETASACVFCGSPKVLPQEANRNALRPESLVPLDVGRAKAEQAFRTWISSRWFRPNALKHTKEFRAIGVYVPYWTFDCLAHSDWSADAGYYYYVTVPATVIVNGKLKVVMRQERRVRWEPAWGARDDAYDDLLVLGSKGLSEKLAAELGGFDLKALVPYRPEYLAGWRAEEYQVDLEGAWELGKQRIAATQQARCSKDVPGDTQRNLAVHNTLSEIRWKHVLLPVWSLSYQFQGRPYSVLIHGQTARIVGEAPLSWLKIALLVGGIAAAVGIASIAVNA